MSLAENAITSISTEYRLELGHAIKTALKCSQFGMCKIDYIGTGVCTSGNEQHYNAYYPQGRMEIAVALYENRIPVTPELVNIVESCTLCKICRKQCYFSMELNPLEVMKALKRYLDKYFESGNRIIFPEVEDQYLIELQKIVGEKNATNDPAILVTYSKVRSPLIPRQMPRYVVLPGSSEEVAKIVRLANEAGISVVPRGNGTSFFGALTDGIVLDLIRFKKIVVNKDNWSVDLGAGVTAFELQQELHKSGLRANTAEPAASVCANVVSTNLHSLFSYSYGAGAENFINGEYVDANGEIHTFNENGGPNYFSLEKSTKSRVSPSIIVTGIKMKIYPLPENEKAVLVPFSTFSECISFAKKLATARIGSAVGLVGNEYIANFISPTSAIAEKTKEALSEKLGIQHCLIVVCDEILVQTLKKMTDIVIDSEIVDLMHYNLSDLDTNDGLAMFNEVPSNIPLYQELFKDEMIPLLRMSMTGDQNTIVSSVDTDLKNFFSNLHQRKEITDLRWLTTFRISSARIGRGHMFIPKIMWIPFEESSISYIVDELKALGEKHRLKSDFGYIVPVEMGKRAIMEFDYYFDHSDAEETERAKNVIEESAFVLNRIKQEIPGITIGSEIALQGYTRMEGYLYE